MRQRRNPIRNPRADGSVFKAGACFAILLSASACQNADKKNAARVEGGGAAETHATNGASAMVDWDAWYPRAIRIPNSPLNPTWKLSKRLWPTGGWTVIDEGEGWTVHIRTADSRENIGRVDFLDPNDKLLKSYMIREFRNFYKSKFQQTFRIFSIMRYSGGFGQHVKLDDEFNDETGLDVSDLAVVISMMATRYGLDQDQYEILYDAPRKGEY